MLLKTVKEQGGHIVVETDTPCTGTFVGPEGKVLSIGEGTSFEYTAAEEPYVRFEGNGESGLIFLQPMWAN